MDEYEEYANELFTQLGGSESLDVKEISNQSNEYEEFASEALSNPDILDSIQVPETKAPEISVSEPVSIDPRTTTTIPFQTPGYLGQPLQQKEDSGYSLNSWKDFSDGATQGISDLIFTVYNIPKAYELGKERFQILADKANPNITVESWRKLKAQEDFNNKQMIASGVDDGQGITASNIIKKVILGAATQAPQIAQQYSEVSKGLMDGYSGLSLREKLFPMYGIAKVASEAVKNYVNYSMDISTGDARSDYLDKLSEKREITNEDLKFSEKLGKVAAIPYLMTDMIETYLTGKTVGMVPGWNKLKKTIINKAIDFVGNIAGQSASEAAQKLIVDVSSDIGLALNGINLDASIKDKAIRIGKDVANEFVQSIPAMTGIAGLGSGAGALFSSKPLDSLSEANIKNSKQTKTPTTKEELYTPEGAQYLIQSKRKEIEDLIEKRKRGENISRTELQKITGIGNIGNGTQRNGFIDNLKNIVETQTQKGVSSNGQESSSEKGQESLQVNADSDINKQPAQETGQAAAPDFFKQEKQLFIQKYNREPDENEIKQIQEVADIKKTSYEIEELKKEPIQQIDSNGNPNKITIEDVLDETKEPVVEETKTEIQPETQVQVEPKKEVDKRKLQFTREEWDQLKDDPAVFEKISEDEYNAQEYHFDKQDVINNEIILFANSSLSQEDETAQSIGASIESAIHGASSLFVKGKPKKPARSNALINFMKAKPEKRKEMGQYIKPGELTKYNQAMKEYSTKMKKWEDDVLAYNSELVADDFNKIRYEVKKVLNENKDSKNPIIKKMVEELGFLDGILDRSDQDILIGNEQLMKELRYGHRKSAEKRLGGSSGKVANKSKTDSSNNAVKGPDKTAEISKEIERKISEYQKSLEPKSEEEPNEMFAPKKKKGMLKEKKKEEPYQTPAKVPTGVKVPQIDDFFDKAYGKKVIEGSLKIFDETKKLVKSITDRLIGVGYQGRKNAGVFYRDTKNIFVESLNNIGVAAHEVAHFLSNKYKFEKNINRVIGQTKDGKPKYNPYYNQIVKQLTQIYVEYYPGGDINHSRAKRVEEGIATFIQRFIEDSSNTSANYPQLVEHFIDKGGDFFNQSTIELIKGARAILRKYESLDSLGQIQTIIKQDVEKMDGKMKMSFWERIRFQWAHKKLPAEMLTKKSGEWGTPDDMYAWLEAYGYLPNIIGKNIEGSKGFMTIDSEGNFFLKHKFNLKTLTDSLHKIGRREQFEAWLIARRQYFEYKRLDDLNESSDQAQKEIESIQSEVQSGDISESDAKKEIDPLIEIIKERDELSKVLENDAFDRSKMEDAYKQHEKEFKDYAKIYDTLNRETLELLNHPLVQILKDDKFKELTDREGYTSMSRYFDNELIGQGEYKSQAPKTKISFLKNRTGSKKEIISPLYSMARQYSEALKKSMKQIVWNKMYNLAIADPDLFQRLKLETAFVNGKVTYPQMDDPNIVMARKGYEMVPMAVNKEFKQLIESCVTPANFKTVEKMFLAATRTMTKGITAMDWMFAVRNVPRDSVYAFAMSENNYIPLIDQSKMLYNALRYVNSVEAKYAREYMDIAGTSQTYKAMASKSPEEFFQQMNNEKSVLNKMIDAAETGADWFSIPSAGSEIATRIAEYIKARKAGKHQVVALEEAARVSGAFSHTGNLWGSDFAKIWIKSISFFHAKLEIMDGLIAKAKDGDIKAKKRVILAWLAVQVANTAGIAALLALASDEQKREYLAKTANELAGGLWFPWPGKENKLFKYPIGQEFGFISTFFNMLIAERLLKADYDGADYYDTLTSWMPEQFNLGHLSAAIVSWLPNIVSIGVSQAMEKTFWPKTRDMETQSEKNIEAEFRKRPNTTWLAKKIAHMFNKFNMSPIKIDALIKQAGGTFASDVADLLGSNKKKNPFIKETYFGSSRQFLRYYDHRAKVNQRFESAKDGYRELKDVDAVLYQKVKYIDKMLKVFRGFTDREIKTKMKDPDSIKLRNDILTEMAALEAEYEKR